MRKIYLKENSLESLVKGRLLPQFLFKKVKEHNTSLGDCDAFPTSTKYPYDYSILKERYSEVCERMEKLGFEDLEDIDGITNALSSMVKECMKIEKPIRNQLETICTNAVNRLFAIPKDMIEFSCKLVGKVDLRGKKANVEPSDDNDSSYQFNDTDEIRYIQEEIEKRRLIDSLIIGSAYIHSNMTDVYEEDIDSLDKRLIPLYDKITAINDYLLFTKKDDITDKNPKQGAYVEVHLGYNGLKTLIEAQGMIFPLLLQDTIKGLFELFSSHGLPSDMDIAKYIVSKADYLSAEPWDLRFGVILWREIFNALESTKMAPYAFTELVKLPPRRFMVGIKEILSKTRKGEMIVSKMIGKCEYDRGYQAFKDRINTKNLSKTVLADSYFTVADLSALSLDNDDADDDVIEEDN